jgi:hypothetical protein
LLPWMCGCVDGRRFGLALLQLDYCNLKLVFLNATNFYSPCRRRLLWQAAPLCAVRPRSSTRSALHTRTSSRYVCCVLCVRAVVLGRAGGRSGEREREGLFSSLGCCMHGGHAWARTGVSPAHGRSYPAYERLAHWTVAMRTHGSNPGPGSWDRSSHERQAGAHGTADGGTQVPPPLRRLPIIMNYRAI